MAGENKTLFLEWEGVKLEDETTNFYEVFEVIVGCDDKELLFRTAFFPPMLVMSKISFRQRFDL